MKNIAFIINPISGKSHKNQLPGLINRILDKERFDVDLKISEYAGHAKVLAQEAVEACYDVVAVAGGDGSINEVGTQLIGTDIAQGVIPCGAGNGLSRCLNIPLKADKALEVINRDAACLIDTVTVNDIPFISISGTGYDAQVADDYGKDPRRGFDTYFR